MNFRLFAIPPPKKKKHTMHNLMYEASEHSSIPDYDDMDGFEIRETWADHDDLLPASSDQYKSSNLDVHHHQPRERVLSEHSDQQSNIDNRCSEDELLVFGRSEEATSNLKLWQQCP